VSLFKSLVSGRHCDMTLGLCTFDLPYRESIVWRSDQNQPTRKLVYACMCMVRCGFVGRVCEWCVVDLWVLTRVGVYVGVCVSESQCIHRHTQTHTLNMLYSDVSPGVSMQNLEGPKSAIGQNLCIYVFLNVYKVHMCTCIISIAFFLQNILSSEIEKQNMCQ